MRVSQYTSFILNQFGCAWCLTDKTTLSDWASYAPSAPLSLPPCCSALRGGADLQIASPGLPCPLDSHWVWLVGGTCQGSEGKRREGLGAFFSTSCLLHCLGAGCGYFHPQLQLLPGGVFQHSQILNAKVTLPQHYSLLQLLDSGSLNVPMGALIPALPAPSSKCLFLDHPRGFVIPAEIPNDRIFKRA